MTKRMKPRTFTYEYRNPRVGGAEMSKPTLKQWMDAAPVELPAELLCQDMERKLAKWYESKLDAKETFRRFFPVRGVKPATPNYDALLNKLGSSLTNEEK